MNIKSRFHCPTCGFAVFNRRVAKCESCSTLLPADFLFSPQELSAIDADHERLPRGWTPNRLRVSLSGLADFAKTIPQSVVDAAASVSCAPFSVVFDQVTSFIESHAFVLRCDAGSDAAIARLRRPLASALRRFGLRPAASGTPHMTLFYGQCAWRDRPSHP